MACSACARRKKALLAKLAAKKAKGKTVQAAAIGAVITTTGLVGKLIGEAQDEQIHPRDQIHPGDPAGRDSSDPASGS